MDKRFIFVLVFLFVILSVSGCQSKDYSPIDDSKLLTEIVYYNTVKENENYQLRNANKNKRFSNDFSYSSLSIHRSYGFEVTLDFVMTPYFDNYVIGDKVDVIIAMINLYGGNTNSNPLAQDMIIFCYKDQIYGFLSPTAGTINELNSRNENELDFESCMFLTKEAVIKYYEPGDYLYSFDLKELENHNIELTARQIKAFDYDYGEKESKVNVIENSYVELNSNEVIDLINLSIVKKIEVEAVITNIDLESGKIYVDCESQPTLKSVTYSFNIIDSNGNFYLITDLNIGDKILVYYYQRYKNYTPVNIRVDNIIIK